MNQANDDLKIPEVANRRMELLTATEIAKELKVSEFWVRDHASGRRQPVLPHINLGTQHQPLYRFDRRVIQQWLNDIVKKEQRIQGYK